MIRNVDTLYDLSVMVCKCEVYIWTVFVLYDIKVILIIFFNVSSFKIYRIILIYSISLTQTKDLQKLPNYREGWAHNVC